MQPPTAPPRDGLTDVVVASLLRDAAGVETAAGCELVDLDLNVVEDITDRLAAGEVRRDSNAASVHGSARLAVEGALDWGTAILRPYMTLSAPGVTARFNLGAYFTPTPTTQAGGDPLVHDVEAVDILDLLDDPVGDAYAVPAGDSYLATVEEILLGRGYTRYVLDQRDIGMVLPTARTWSMDQNMTWLGIVNDLLSSIGYQPIWSDWDGQPRIEPYATPAARASEWLYDTGLDTSMLTEDRSVERDLYKAPNKWVFYRSNNLDAAPPVEGDGVYTYVNQFDGPTSVQARDGRTITRPPVPLDIADHAALIAAAQIIIDADMRPKTTVKVGGPPNPLHWHQDRLSVDDPAIAAVAGVVGPVVEVIGMRWTLPLDGKNMSHEWQVM
jgi:hypothetical protein